MVIGFVFAFGSAIFEVDNWSIAKQTIMHFLLTSIVFLPCAVLAKWVASDLLSIVFYFLIFILIYFIIWIIQYFIWKNEIAKLNKKLKTK
jgi:drug/metabolite transporter (DMT)-like permease